jgi:flagellar FliL protein
MASAAAAAATTEGEAPEGAKKKGKGKLLLLVAIPVVLLGAGAGLWFTGILPGLLGMGAHPPPSGEHAADAPPAPPGPPAFFEMPDIVANLNAPGRRPTFVKLRARIEVPRAEDAAALQAAMPRLLDLFQTYLREMRPEELRGSAGTQRLREELVARANIAAAMPGREGPPVRVSDVLFLELLIQ